MVRSVLASLTVVAVFVWQVPAKAETTDAAAVIEDLHDLLIGVMKEADALGYEGRRERLAPVVRQVYNTPLIARGTVGDLWGDLTKPDRKRLVETMRRLTIATYAGRFRGYGGELFRTVGEDVMSDTTRLVKTELVTGGGEVIQLNYVMHRSKKGWRIVDVYLNGIISEVGMRRAEYTATIKRGGLDELLARLEDQIKLFEDRP